MKALSIVSPNGTKIAAGLKTLEVRKWQPFLHADEDLLIVENTRFLRREGEKDYDGKAVAIVRVVNIRPFSRADVNAACANYFEEGWLAWELTNIRSVSCSKPVLAARGIYDVQIDLKPNQ